MKKQVSTSRRNFLKTSAAGAAGIGIIGILPKKAEAARAWADRDAVNPNIDNLRVVCCYDPNMVLKDCEEISNFPQMTNQNAATTVDRDVIRANLDAMAKALAEKTSISEAWQTIFRKPDSKSWGDVKVAIKVNGIGVNHPRIAIVGKICDVLNGLGVQYSNIIVYDGCHNAYQHYNNFTGTDNLPSGYSGAYLPTGVQVSDKNSLLGDTIPANVPGVGTEDCTAHIADGTIDILVNIAVNKNHDDFTGNTTLTMKNHYGTFAPADHGEKIGFGYIAAINKSDAILGGNPTRQQLCIIDSLWASTSGGPGANPNSNTYRIIMGTFGPAVDYLTVKEIRGPAVMGASHNDSIIARFLTDFGYQESEIGSLVTVEPGSATADKRMSGSVSQNSSLCVTVDGSGFAVRSAHIKLTENEKISSVDILNAQGQKVRHLNISQRGVNSHLQIFWDGRSDAGFEVAKGTYLIAVVGAKGKYTGRLLLQK